MKYKPLDVIKLRKNVTIRDSYDLKKKEITLLKGEIGTIIECFNEPEATYEVEFMNPDGSTKVICTLKPNQFEKT